jgi:ankyrin repeat protein
MTNGGSINMTTPLLGAIIRQSPSAVQSVLLQRPDVNELSPFGDFTPLHFSVSTHIKDSEDNARIIALLHQAGADLEARTLNCGLSLGGGKTVSANRFTPLHMSTATNKPLSLLALIKCGADVNAADGSGATALHTAVVLGYLDIAKILLEAGADPYRPDNAGKTSRSLAENSSETGIRQLFMGK